MPAHGAGAAVRGWEIRFHFFPNLWFPCGGRDPNGAGPVRTACGQFGNKEGVGVAGGPEGAAPPAAKISRCVSRCRQCFHDALSHDAPHSKPC